MILPVKIVALIGSSLIAAVVVDNADKNVYIPVWIAAVVCIGTIASPAAASYFNGRARRSEKELDWKRQDEVARRAASVASDAKQAVQDVKKTLETADLSTKHTLIEIANTGDKIHTLVNSNMGKELASTAFYSNANAISLRRIAEMTGDPMDRTLAEHAEVNAREAERRAKEHEAKQAKVDAALA